MDRAEFRGMERPCECQTPEEMCALGAGLAAKLGSGWALGLCGPLGAGKTQLVKGLAEGLGHCGVVTSPTFTLMHEYRGGREALFHFDFFRVRNEGELLDLGWDEFLEEGVVVVEWADRFPQLMPRNCLWLELEMRPGGGRIVTERDSPAL